MSTTACCRLSASERLAGPPTVLVSPVLSTQSRPTRGQWARRLYLYKNTVVRFATLQAAATRHCVRNPRSQACPGRPETRQVIAITSLGGPDRPPVIGARAGGETDPRAWHTRPSTDWSSGPPNASENSSVSFRTEQLDDHQDLLMLWPALRATFSSPESVLLFVASLSASPPTALAARQDAERPRLSREPETQPACVARPESRLLAALPKHKP